MDALEQIYALQPYDFDSSDLAQHTLPKEELPEVDPSRSLQQGNNTGERLVKKPTSWWAEMYPAWSRSEWYHELYSSLTHMVEHADKDTTSLIIVILVLCFAHLNLK